ncbi:hypothetical protein YB2330_004782 [Saitoella coloradoensis]
MATTVTAFLTETITATVAAASVSASASASATAGQSVTPQGGILEGENPTHYDPKNPIILFIIQAGIIIIFCRLLHYPLSLLRQPRVIAEVIGGVLLGPSVMGRIPSFTSTIFPPAAIPNLSLVANLGLVLFLFIVGLEVDLRWVRGEWRVAAGVAAAGMGVPFGLGVGIAYGLYHDFRDEPGTEPIAFGTYALFIGVAMAITAFPVLCRILTELKLLSTPVGIIVLSAGVGNDVVGWILLALCVALVNSGSGVAAVWVLLTAVGYTLFLFFAVRPAFMSVLKRTRALEDGPSQGVIALTLLIALSSAFFTGVIGVHPIFGAFMAGLICPHDGGFAIKVTEKIEDLVSALFLPLYFALSGLSTNVGLLDSGKTWGYVIGVTLIAFLGKFSAASVAARMSGLFWRESMAIGSLMSCKGLVELIVLNIGLQARILSQRTFTIFVVMALVTTFATTPLTVALYPMWYQKKLEAWKKGLIDWDTGRPTTKGRAEEEDVSVVAARLESGKVRDLLVYLRLENMPALMTFVSLLGGRPHEIKRVHPSHAATPSEAEPTAPTRPVEVHGVRLMELTERDSSVMRVSEAEDLSWRDPIINTFRNFGRLYNLGVSGEVLIAPESSFAELLVSQAGREGVDMLLLPWSEGGMREGQRGGFEGLRDERTYAAFVGEAVEGASSTCNVAVLVNKGFGGSSPVEEHRLHPLRRRTSAMNISAHSHSVREKTVAPPIPDRSHHVYMPFFGGADGRVALRLVLQLAANADITATIVFFERVGSGEASSSGVDLSPTTSRTEDTPLRTVQSKTKDSTHEAELQDRDLALFESIRRSLPENLASRVLLESAQTSTPIEDAMARAEMEVGQNLRNAGDLIVVARKSNAIGATDRPGSSYGTLGVLGGSFVDRGLSASVLVVQGARGHRHE